MRDVRRFSEPLAIRQGVHRWGGWATIASLILVLGSMSSARAAGVTVEIGALAPLVPLTTASCEVSVANGADGVAVLAAAQAAGCIDSYQTSDGEFGTFLECIDGVCGTPATYWRMALDGAATPYGLDGYEARAGDTLAFSYTVWAGCLVDPSVC